MQVPTRYLDTAASGRRMNQDKTPFIEPAVGKDMGMFNFKLDGSTVRQNILYMVHPPAQFLSGIVYSSVVGRLKSKKEGQHQLGNERDVS